MRLLEKILVILICLPSIYSSVIVFTALKAPDLFLLMGFTGLVLMVLSGYMVDVIIAALYVPAIASFILFLLNYPQPIMGLAAGYVIALTLLLLLVMFNHDSPHTYLAIYLISIFLDMSLLAASKTSTTSELLLRNLFYGVRKFHGVMDPVFSIVIVPSVAALLYHIFRLLKPSTSTITSSHRSLIILLLSSLPILGLTILSRYSPGYAWISSTILSLILTIFLVLYLNLGVKIT
ncbi:MAG: hypothetical protein DRN68_03035 [Thaumarchaeota archaeon]|nr:MAG: hypothetical protein DRN68_03035 [Nitrososphaerota archaeon]HDD56468.1 hypothetical protein [Nitrososphaeria archaeon]